MRNTFSFCLLFISMLRVFLMKIRVFPFVFLAGGNLNCNEIKIQFCFALKMQLFQNQIRKVNAY